MANTEYPQGVHPESCYFWVDVSIPEEYRGMSAMCLKCYSEMQSEIGWFYDGARGYGPFDVICDNKECGRVIHKHTGENAGQD